MGEYRLRADDYSVVSIARVIEPAVATNIEPPKRLHPAQRGLALG